MPIELQLHAQTRRLGPRRGQRIWTARIRHSGRVSTRHLAHEVARGTTYAQPELEAALELYFQQLTDRLREGYIVELGSLGTLQLEGGSEDVDAPEDFDSRVHMKPLHLSFVPNRHFAYEALSDLHFHLNP